MLKFDKAEVTAGIYGFNSALVGIATLFFFRPGAVSVGLLDRRLHRGGARDMAGSPARAVPDLHRAVHRHDLGTVLSGAGHGRGAGRAGGPPAATGFMAAVAHGIGQVMFQASIWTALLFLIGIAISDWQHALWVMAGSVLGMLVGIYHHDSPEEVAALGLYGYNATLAAVALFLWRRSLIPPLLGILLSVPLTEFLPLLGYTGPDGSFRAGDLAGTRAWLARRQAFQSPARRPLRE